MGMAAGVFLSIGGSMPWMRCVRFTSVSVPISPSAPVSEHHASSGATVLPEVRLVVLSSALACLHINRGFIRLNVTPANRLSPHGGDHRDEQLADFEDPAAQRCAADVQAEASPLSFFLLALESATSCAYCPYERQGPGGTINAVHRNAVRAGIRHIGELSGRMDGYRGRR
jgi:hypothetical protein